MANFLAMFGFLVVVLRAAILCLQSIAAGGVFFLTVITRGAEQSSDSFSRGAWKLMRWCGLGLAICQLLFVITNSLVLTNSTDLQFRDVIGANFVLAGLVSIAAGLSIFFWPTAWRTRNLYFLYVPALIAIAASVMTSHSASRMEDRPFLVTMTTAHYLATASWIGGLPYLWLAVKRFTDNQVRMTIVARFSRMALISVAVLLIAGFGMSFLYVGSWAAVYGTAYGVMVSTKAILLGCLMLLGAANFFIVRNIRNDQGTGIQSLRRFAEAEIGIGLTVILAAASLTSQPPSADLLQDRVTFSDIAIRYAPRMPRFESPDSRELSKTTAQIVAQQQAAGIKVAPAYVPGADGLFTTGPADIAWSEYNHNWAGIIVFLMGILALLSRSRYFSWAKVWPLMFLGLAVFLFLRADPENWPLGPNGFWESFKVTDVLQHRLAVVLIIVFAIFQYRVETNRIKSQAPALVFPAVCAIGGIVLLTHTHALANVKESMLIELSHTPLAIFGIVAGWTRWLELRLPEENPTRRVLAWIWPVCFIIVGLILMDYHEADIRY